MSVDTKLFLGDTHYELSKIGDNSVDLIVTSPPYADQRKETYGGIPVNKYVDWFLPISQELLGIFKPTGTFIGKDYYNLIKQSNFLCIKNLLWFPWVIGQKTGCEILMRLIKHMIHQKLAVGLEKTFQIGLHLGKIL